MYIYKFLKPLLPAVMVAATGIFIAGCSSSDDSPAPVLAQCEDGIDNDTDGLTDFPADPGCINALDNDENDPPIPTDGITGIWTGTMTWSTTGSEKDYTVTMLFHTPEGAERGVTGGAAFGKSPTDADEPHFLFEGGYEYSALPIENEDQTIACNGDVWAVGRFGQQGTFIQEFKYTTGDVAGPDQRGGGCLYLEDADGDGFINELTGEMQFEEAGKLTVALTYSTDNTRDVSVSDLGTLASDEGTVDVEYHLWSNDNSGNFMAYTTNGPATVDTIDLAVVENHSDPLVNCRGDVKATKVAGQNLFTLVTNTDVEGCTVSPVGTILPDNSSAKNVDLHYEGLGALYDLDADGTLEFIHLMASRGSGSGYTAQALYNQFIVQ